MINKDILVKGNGSDKTIVGKGTKFVTVFNPNPYNISLYRDTADLTNRIGYVAAYSNQTIPLPNLGVNEFPLLISWVGSGSAKIMMYFTTESLNINQSFGGAGASDNVTIVGDTVGLPRAEQLPAALTGTGNLKVAIQEAAALLKPTDLNIDGSKNLGVVVTGTTTVNVGNTPTVNVGNTPNVGVDFTGLITALNGYFSPKTAGNTSIGATLTVDLDTGETGGRLNVEIFVQSSNSAVFNIYGSIDGVNYRLLDSISITGAGSNHTGFNNAYRYIRVSTTAANDNIIEIAASR